MPGYTLSLYIGFYFGGDVFKKKPRTDLTSITEQTEFEVVKKADEVILLTWYVASSDGTIPLCLRMLFARNSHTC